MPRPTPKTATPSLSVCCMTAGPAGRVAALLALYRPLAAELFVAVDDRARDAVTAAAGAAGARVVRYPYAEPVDRPLAWLHEQCTGDWVLTIDDDEVPSAGLLAALPRLLVAGDVTHYWIPRRWLFPASDRYLDEAPWRPDYQLRLVENDPRLLRFFEETHRPIEVVGPGRYLELPVYHADCVLNPVERRAEKALKYERLRPGKRVAGGAMSHVFYLPERRPEARTAAVPQDDLRLVLQVLDAGEPPPPARPPDVRPATREEIDRLWVGRELPDSAYRARIHVADLPDRLVAGEQRTVDARIENLGGQPWAWGELGRPEVRVSYRWLAADGAPLVADGLRTPFPAPVGPGETVLVPVHVVAPAATGRHVLELDLVHEHVRWFGCAVRCAVEVVPPRRVAVYGAGPPLESALEQIAGSAPELEPVVLVAAGGDASGPGHARAPSADAYLLGAAREGRLLAAPRVAARTLALVRAARRASAGRPPADLPRGGAGFLEALRGAELLVLVSREPGTRGLWAAAATVLASRALGVPPVAEPSVVETAGGALERVLGRLVRRAASVGPPDAAVTEALRRRG